MINEKELRPGNWYATIRNQEVIIKGFDTVNKFVIIDPLNADMEITSANSNSIIFEDLHPIEITEQRLLQFGFSKQDFVTIDVVSDKGAKFHWDENNKYIFLQDCSQGIIGQAIKYVHQFQNLYYALTGKELVLSKALI